VSYAVRRYGVKALLVPAFCGLEIQKTGPRRRAGQWAGIIAPEDRVSISREGAITPVGNITRHSSQNSREPAPHPAQFVQNEKHGIGSGEQRFLARGGRVPRIRRVIENHVKSVEAGCVGSMPRQDALCEPTLQRGKAENCFPIMFQDEAHNPIAEAAYSVVEKNGMILAA
jgi:hypothetical protein